MCSPIETRRGLTEPPPDTRFGRQWTIQACSIFMSTSGHDQIYTPDDLCGRRIASPQAVHFIILSWCMMERRRIRPAPGDLLTSDRHLPEMMRYVQHLVEGDEPEVVARNAALVYLAIITAFAERGLLQADWAPRLVIDVEGREFEVSEKLSLPPADCFPRIFFWTIKKMCTTILILLFSPPPHRSKWTPLLGNSFLKIQLSFRSRRPSRFSTR
jgi:hypothetical protein